jgi:hypothetical protein
LSRYRHIACPAYLHQNTNTNTVLVSHKHKTPYVLKEMTAIHLLRITFRQANKTNSLCLQIKLETNSVSLAGRKSRSSLCLSVRPQRAALAFTATPMCILLRIIDEHSNYHSAFLCSFYVLHKNRLSFHSNGKIAFKMQDNQIFCLFPIIEFCKSLQRDELCWGSA